MTVENLNAFSFTLKRGKRSGGGTLWKFNFLYVNFKMFSARKIAFQILHCHKVIYPKVRNGSPFSWFLNPALALHHSSIGLINVSTYIQKSLLSTLDVDFCSATYKPAFILHCLIQDDTGFSKMSEMYNSVF